MGSSTFAEFDSAEKKKIKKVEKHSHIQTQHTINGYLCDRTRSKLVLEHGNLGHTLDGIARVVALVHGSKRTRRQPRPQQLPQNEVVR